MQISVGLGVGVGPKQPAAGGFGPELVTNGNFSSDVGWTLNQAAIDSGVLILAGFDAGEVSASRTAAQAITAGTYRYSIDLVEANGSSFIIRVGGTDSAAIGASQTGNFTGDINSAASDQLVTVTTSDGSFIGQFDNFSVKRIL
jgi:hypothetical protein